MNSYAIYRIAETLRVLMFITLAILVFNFFPVTAIQIVMLALLNDLKLSVAGHLTVFLARTRGPFWSTRPARVLLLAVLGTQMIATLIAVYGIFMTPIGWGYAALVWGYALVWFLLTDRVKLFAYTILDPLPATVPVGGDPTATVTR